MSAAPSERLRELGIVLPPPPRPAGTYVPVSTDGTLAWVAGQIVTKDGAIVSPGQVDREVPVTTARDLARQATLQALSALQHQLGSIDRVRKVVRAVVYISTAPGFSGHVEVANAATEVLVEIFGEAGRPARAAIGVASLPLNASVEVELQVAIVG